MILAALALTASATAAGDYPRPLTQAERAVIMKKADEVLFDGPSARWQWPDKLNDKDSYCGFINAKNRMGGYTGWRPFYYGLGRFGILEDDEGKPSSNRIMYELICGVGGYNPKPDWLPD